jgi:hypothetical protein
MEIDLLIINFTQMHLLHCPLYMTISFPPQVSVLLQKVPSNMSPASVTSWLSPTQQHNQPQRTPSESSENESSAESSLAEEEEEGWESGN